METLLKALENSEELINFTLQKAKLFDDFKTQFNERQSKVLKKMLEEGTKGFEGGMNAKNYMRITKTSKSTATRDLQKLNEMGAFKSFGKGKNTMYKIQFID